MPREVMVAAQRAGCDTDLRLSKLPPYVADAFIAVEDRRFYSHFGVDLVGVARAATHDLAKASYVEGASTITQQLARTLFLSRKRSWMRKLREAGLALWLEHELSKRQILRLYLSCIYLGPGVHGVDQASQLFFGHDARGLSLGEAALVAGAASSPARYSPLRHRTAAELRAGHVLAVMHRIRRQKHRP